MRSSVSSLLPGLASRLSLKKRSRWWQPLLTRPSSPSRTPACSTSCANPCSSRPLPPTCSKSSAARPSTSKQCSTRLSNRLSASAKRTRPSSVDRKAQLIILKRATDFHPSLPNSSQLILLEWMEARFRDAFCSNEELFTFPTFWLIQNTPMGERPLGSTALCLASQCCGTERQ